MTVVQTLGAEAQEPASEFRAPWLLTSVRAGGLLGNDTIQFFSPARRFIVFEKSLVLANIALGIRRAHALSKLDELKRRRFTVQGKAERVARSLAALYQVETIQLSPEKWRRVVEDPDAEDQFS